MELYEVTFDNEEGLKGHTIKYAAKDLKDVVLTLERYLERNRALKVVNLKCLGDIKVLV